jgi:hypothetical protein
MLTRLSTERRLIMNDYSQDALIEAPGVGNSPPGTIRVAAETTIQAKRDAGLIGAEHEMTIALILQLASASDRGLVEPKVSVATTTLAKEVREALASLPAANVVDDPEWNMLVAALRGEE